MIFNHGYSLKINKNRCLNQWHEGVKCTHCVENCPTEAIFSDSNQVRLNTGLCNGCGLCLSDCPTQAFSSSQWDETTVLRVVEQEGWEITEVFCAKHKAPYKQTRDKKRGAVQLPACLSIVSKGGWYELGSSTELELHCEECEACPISKTLVRLEYNLGTAVEWLGASGKDPGVSYINKTMNVSTKKNLRALETGMRVTSRRELFISLIDQGRNKLVDKINEFTNSSPSNRKSIELRPGSCLPNWRRRLAKVFPKNQKDVTSPAYWPIIKIADQCMKCEMCSRFCPSGALRTVLENGAFTHYFTSGLCLDCRTCQLFCPQQAITRDRELIENPFETISVASKHVDVCQVCGKPTNDASKHLCYMCEKELVHENQLVDSCKKLLLSI